MEREFNKLEKKLLASQINITHTYVDKVST